ncbi:MAG: hypothetical protein JO137_20000 [Hyphomicrobiales bacterium]|nr:hypothetical protein [Hyphomicrobiales bacterium]MBV9434113.1 hypothetical protein [Hyphomicrobiales bacterium]
MRNHLLNISRGAGVVGAAGGGGPSDAADINAVLRSFDSAAWRFQLAETLGILLAIKRKGAGECNFVVDDAEVRALSTWLEQPSTEVADTSAFVTRRDQVDGIMSALLELAPAAVCEAAEEKLSGSLKHALHR